LRPEPILEVIRPPDRGVWQVSTPGHRAAWVRDTRLGPIRTSQAGISSIALENIAISHPGVAEAATIAAHHPKWQERPPLVLVVPKPGWPVTPESVLALFTDQVARWWIPDAVLVVDELPHGATGKLNKVALRERYANY
jgi:fatty-acyl-CoA synthase